MKLIFGVFLFLSQYTFGQTYSYPKCNSQADSDLRIVKVSRSDYSTILDFEYVRTEAKGIYILLGAPNTDGAFYIKADGKTFKLTSTNGIGNSDKITFAVPYKPVNFSATFESIPKSVTQFDLIEGGSNGSWHFYGVNLVSTSNFVAETKTLKSEAKMRESDTPLSNTIFTLQAGTRVGVLSLVGGYYKVEYNGKEGFINEVHFVTPTEAPSPKINPNSKTEKEYNKLVTEADFKSYISQNFQNFTPIVGIYKIRASILIYVDGELFDKRYVEYNHGEDKAAIINDGSSHFQLVINQFIKEESTKMRIESNANYNEFFLENSMGESNRFTLNDRGNFELIKQIPWEKYCELFGVQKNNPQRYRLKAFQNIEYIKMFPSEIEVQKIEASKQPETRKSSGSGFGISSDGIIITCNHVVDGAKSIKVRGIDGNFDKGYSAKVLISDKNNDLSIIKIDDLSFSNIESIPFVIRSSTVNVGENIFVLGYPLRSTMGDEIKLTNGIVSSKSGFQGDVTSYQISAPIQPGNSGGPLFDDKGNIIGIINAKHIGAENASYAIKTAYLLNLIDLMPAPPKLQTISTVSGKPLTEQIKVLKKFTYIIEIN